MAIANRTLGEGWKTEYSDDKRFKAVFLQFSEGSEYGIDGGRISKLCVKELQPDKSYRGYDVANYDRGWDVVPKYGTPCWAFCQKIIGKYNWEKPRDVQD